MGYSLASKIVKEKKSVLDTIAKTLIERETIEKDEFDEIIKKARIKKIEIK